MISAVLTSFNSEKFISDSIESVLIQPEVNELIVVDDASTDHSVEIILELAKTDSRVKLVELQRNQGIANARNVGISNARSEWIRSIDADDAWIPGSCGLLLKLCNKNKVDSAMGMAENFLDLKNSRSVPSWIRQEWLEGPQPGWLNLGTLLINRKLFTEIGMFNTNIQSGADDFDWFTRFKSQKIKYTTTNTIVYKRRLHFNNVSSRANPNLYNDMLISVRKYLK